MAELEGSDVVGSVKVWVPGSVSAHEIVGLLGRGLRVRVWNCSEVERVVVVVVDRKRKIQVKEKRRVEAFLVFPSIE